MPSSDIASGTPTSRCIRRFASLFRARSRDDGGDSSRARRARISRGRDAGAAAAVRRRDGASVHHAPQRARHAALSAHRRRAVSQAAGRRRLRSRVRDRARLSKRGHRSDAQSGVHDARVLRGVCGLHRDDVARGVARGPGRRRRAQRLVAAGGRRRGRARDGGRARRSGRPFRAWSGFRRSTRRSAPTRSRWTTRRYGTRHSGSVFRRWRI